MQRQLYQVMASKLAALRNCEKDGIADWQAKHEAALDELAAELPSGSGWDNGTKLDLARSTPERLVFFGAYHHMDDGGGYDGWTEHTITVTPSLAFGIRVAVGGRNRNDIKDYLAELFQCALTAIVE